MAHSINHDLYNMGGVVRLLLTITVGGFAIFDRMEFQSCLRYVSISDIIGVMMSCEQ